MFNLRRNIQLVMYKLGIIDFEFLSKKKKIIKILRNKNSCLILVYFSSEIVGLKLGLFSYIIFYGNFILMFS